MPISSVPLRKLLKLATAAALLAVALLMATFALPLPLWRTGEHPLPALEYQPVAGSTHDGADQRLWIDADPACGTGRRRDPDDCLALLSLLRSPRHVTVGVSTVFGNAPLAVTDRVARALLGRVDPATRPPLYRGCDRPLAQCATTGPPPAVAALTAQLRRAPLHLVALGPLTNLAAVLASEPALARQITQVVAVMGRRPGHLFHPAEGRSNTGILFGHGPVFRDLNAALDLQAVATVLAADVPLTLLPYPAARDVLLQPTDLQWIATLGAAGAWVAAGSMDWLDYWRRDIGIDGFYPFDLLAAAYLRAPADFRCARVNAWVGRDPLLPLFPRAPALMVTQAPSVPAGATAIGAAVYCDRARIEVRKQFEHAAR